MEEIDQEIIELQQDIYSIFKILDDMLKEIELETFLNTIIDLQKFLC